LATLAKGKGTPSSFRASLLSCTSTQVQPPPRDTSEPPTSPETPPTLLPPTRHAAHAANSIVRLPRLDLPTFSGNALEWQPFWDGFDAAVNLNP